jgi:hypothetical protein
MAKRRKSRKSKSATKCHVIVRKMGAAGKRNVLICPGKPAKIISAKRAAAFRHR